MPIKTIAIIGAGQTGRAIAFLSVLAGYRTILEAVSPELLDHATSYIEAALREGIQKGTVTAQQKTQTFENLSTSRSVEDVCRVADLLIDATQEELEVKLEIFTLFDKFAKPDAILASTSQAIPLADLAGITFRQENCIGLRFRAPIVETKSLEIVRARETSEETLQAGIDFARRLGKEVSIAME